MYVIGLTGNIACGKSTVAEMLRSLGVYVIDADELTHEVITAGTSVHSAIVARFGEEILHDDSEIDRKRLAGIVFADPQALADLEALVHPAVIAETLRLLRACTSPVAVIEAIKLLEAQMRRYCDAVWVVACSRARQVERLVATRQLTAEEAALRIDAQTPQSHKKAHADRIIQNDGPIDDTWRQVLEAWRDIPANTLMGVNTPVKDVGTEECANK